MNSNKNNRENIFREVHNVSTESNKYTQYQYMEDLSGVYLFISIDLVNSTIFKTRYTKYWSCVIQFFYEIVTAALGTDEAYRDKEDGFNIEYIGKKSDYDKDKIKTGGFKVWKLVGDEVLVYHKIVSVSEVLNTMRVMDYLTRNIIQLFLAKGEQYYQENEFKEFKKIAKRHLAAKSTMWVAMCGQSITLECPNMFYDSSSYIGSSEVLLDFLGPDIDAGFRLCSYAEKNKMIISPNLVALLSTQLDSNEHTELKEEVTNGFRIVTYVELEDVWEKRLYPVFMYCPMNGERNKRIDQWKSLFEYDERGSSRLSKFIFEEPNFDSDEFSCKQLNKIYQELGRFDEIQQLQQDFKQQIEQLAEMKNIIPIDTHKFEFHISCVCYDKNTKKIWIHKHEYHGLSFGCIKIDNNHDYRDVVIKAYKEKYEIEIKFEDDDIEFLSFYSVNRENMKDEILGVIIFTEGKSLTKTTQEKGWYSLQKAKQLGDKGMKKIKEYNSVIDKVIKIVEQRY